MRNRASILVGLLWCLALLSLVVVGTLHTARVDLMAGKNFGDRVQAHYLALAGIEKAKALLFKNVKERSHGGKNHTGEFYNSDRDFREIEFGRGTYSVLRRARPDEGGGVIYGVGDEASRLNLNFADTDALTKIQGLTPDIATAIAGWRGQGSTVAETDYYLSLRPPYLARGAAFETIRELLMVRGVAADLALGRDTHQNGLLDVVDAGGAGPGKFVENVSADDLGWAGILTVDSTEKNVNASGEARVNLKTADEATLAGIHGITREMARAIVAYRDQHQFQSVVDLLDVTPPQNNGNARNNNAFSENGASGQHVISDQLFAQIADDITVSDGDTLYGLVNLNTASEEVLICLPGVDRNLANAIIAQRSSAGFFDNIAEVLKVDGMTPEIFRQLAPLVTTRSETYRILAEGRVKPTGATQRVQEIVRINLDGVKTLSYREDDL